MKTDRLMVMWIAAAALALAGCGRQAPMAKSIPPDYLVVKGTGHAEADSGGPAGWVKTLGAALSATAQVDVATSPGGPASLLAARVAARREALRKLAGQLAAAPLGKDRTLGDWLASAPADKRAAFDQIIEERTVVAWRDQPGMSVAVASLPTQAPADWALGEAGATSVAAADNSPDGLSRRAYDLAVEDAKARLREELLKIEVGPKGRTLGQAIKENPSLDSSLSAMLFIVPVDEVNYPRAGSCEVKIFFDRNVARGLAAGSSRHWWWPFH